MTKSLGFDERALYRRRKTLETKMRREMVPGGGETKREFKPAFHSHRIALDVPNGIVLIGGDAHIWPGPATTAFRAFCKFAKDLKPAAVIMNGDAFDGATISRHAPIGWEKRPSVIEELEACQERLGELEAAAGKARKLWTLGNHDSRFETRIATVAPEYARVHGVHLRDHFPLWEAAWSCWINNAVVAKHRIRGGIHAARTNTVLAGKTTVTNHTHQLQVTGVPDYNGTRWGCEAGCLADPDGRQFVDYTEDNPRTWQSGFLVLTFHKGALLQPETVRVFDDKHVDFRGSLVKV
jgi:hypothetical protein